MQPFLLAALSLTAAAAAAAPTRIHIGSCNDPDEAQPMWAVLARRGGKAFFWDGDIVYGDERDGVTAPATAAGLEALYARQRARADYRAYVAGLEVVDGIWDDHDFGLDNARGHSFDAATKDAHKAALLNFVGAPDARREPGRGAYAARRVDDVDVILLDVRYDRGPNGAGLLGEAQWAWLERRLAASSAAATVVVSPIQVLAVGERPASMEGWSVSPCVFFNLSLARDARRPTRYQHPAERTRLLATLANTTAILVSGDVHHAELGEYGCGAATVAELTTSGLSHAIGSPRPALYDSWAWHRFAHYAMWTAQRVLPRHVWTHQAYLGASYLGLNAGEVDVDVDARTVTARALDADGAVALERTWAFDDLRGGARGACAPRRGFPSVHSRRLGFGITYVLVLGPFLLAAVVASGAARCARFLRGLY
jgi:alkaline phosphatase D